MRIPLPLRLLAAGALGAAVVVLPATAASETPPTIENEDVGTVHHWKPPEAKTEAGGTVTFKNTNASIPHGIHWASVPEGKTPSCESTVPVESSNPKWSGGCKFAVAGTYKFWCTVHGEAMNGTITVTTAGGKEPPKETTPGGTTTTPGYPPPGGGGSGGGTSGGSGGSPAALSAAALSALRLTVPRHGTTLHGSLVIPTVDAGGRLEVKLTAARSALIAGVPSTVRVGQLVRRSLKAGPLRFAIAPSPRGLRTLRRRGRLKLTMTVKLTPATGAGGSTTRRVVLHR